MTADDSQGIRQSRVLDLGIPVDRLVIDIEKPLSGRLLGCAAAGCPLSLQVCIIDHGQTAVEAFQVEGDGVKGGERRQQEASLRQCFS